MATASDIAWIVLSSVLGLSVGGFLTVVIYRLPRMMDRAETLLAADGFGGKTATVRLSLTAPGSHCPECGDRIAPLHRLPLIGYALLRGHCATCGSRISARYPIVELLAAAAAAASVLVYGPSPQAVFAVIFMWIAISIAFIDIDRLLVPDVLSFSLLWIGLSANAFALFSDPSSAILGAVAGYTVFWLVGAVAERALGRAALGQGDFKLFAAIGAWFGWQALAPSLLIGAAIGATIGYGLVWIGIRKKDEPICFAPFLLIGALIALLSPGWYSTLFTLA